MATLPGLMKGCYRLGTVAKRSFADWRSQTGVWERGEFAIWPKCQIGGMLYLDYRPMAALIIGRIPSLPQKCCIYLHHKDNAKSRLCQNEFSFGKLAFGCYRFLFLNCVAIFRSIETFVARHLWRKQLTTSPV